MHNRQKKVWETLQGIYIHININTQYHYPTCLSFVHLYIYSVRLDERADLGYYKS